jgi:hypothetical protein
MNPAACQRAADLVHWSAEKVGRRPIGGHRRGNTTTGSSHLSRDGCPIQHLERMEEDR